MCYSTEKSVISSAITTTKTGIVNPMVANIDQELYLEDPLLTFDDSVIYGCKVSLTL
jgi:hypothetical protein